MDLKWYHDSAPCIIARQLRLPPRRLKMQPNARILRSTLLEGARFAHAFPTREASDADLLDALGASGVVQVRQIHGAVAVESADVIARCTPTDADAIVSRVGGSPVGIRVADCVPVLLADEASGDVAAIHAGWRGVVACVVGSAVRLLGPTGRMVAAVGPSIGPCCFEVGAEVAAQTGFVVRHAGDKAFVDLRAAVRAQLRSLGLADERIEDVGGCTKHESRFHSFRRDAADSGRMLVCVRPRSPWHALS
jgi:YfiH family protein